MHKIIVVGTGYVGLVSGVCFSEVGHNVICIDHDNNKIDLLNNGKVPIYEPGLDEILHKNVQSGRLQFSTNLAEHIKDADEIVVAVGTPTNEENGSTDLSFVYSVVDEIIKNLSKDIIVIIKSTVPPGTCDAVQKKFNDSSTSHRCSVVSNPEFLREGNAIKDFMSPDRVIVGCDSVNESKMRSLYDNHISRGIKFISTNLITAELIKYSANTFLAAKVAFINEISSISEKINADISSLKEGIGSDSRIGHKFLEPGPGFGGSCFPKDITSLIHFSEEIDANNALIKSVINSNQNRIEEIAKNVEEFSEGNILCFLGLTYKANTDDVRTSPSIGVIQKLLSLKKYEIKCYDPLGMDSAKRILSDKVQYCGNIYDASEGASLVVIITEWDEFKNIDTQKLKCKMKEPRIYDVRNIININQFKEDGFKVKVIGSKNV